MDNVKRKEVHTYIPAQLYDRVHKYKVQKYNGLKAMNQAFINCIEAGIAVLEKRG